MGLIGRFRALGLGRWVRAGAGFGGGRTHGPWQGQATPSTLQTQMPHGMRQEAVGVGPCAAVAVTGPRPAFNAPPHGMNGEPKRGLRGLRHSQALRLKEAGEWGGGHHWLSRRAPAVDVAGSNTGFAQWPVPGLTPKVPNTTETLTQRPWVRTGGCIPMVGTTRGRALACRPWALRRKTHASNPPAALKEPLCVPLQPLCRSQGPSNRFATAQDFPPQPVFERPVTALCSAWRPPTGLQALQCTDLS